MNPNQQESLLLVHLLLLILQPLLFHLLFFLHVLPLLLLNVQPQQEEPQVLEEELEEVLEEVLEEEQTGSRARVVAQLEFLLCKGRQMLSDMMKTGGKVLLTALLGITGRTTSTTVLPLARAKQFHIPAPITRVTSPTMTEHQFHHLR